jgi:hypothetical protein
MPVKSYIPKKHAVPKSVYNELRQIAGEFDLQPPEIQFLAHLLVSTPP